MNVEQQLETLRFLISTHREEFERRRSYEWRCILAYLTGAALAIGLSGRPEAAHIREAVPAWLIWAIFMALWVSGAAFLSFIYVAHAVNKEIAHRAEAAMQALLNGEDIVPLDLYADLPSRPTIRGMGKVGQGGFWGLLGINVVSLVFAVAAAIALTS